MHFAQTLARYHTLESKVLPDGQRYAVKRGLRGYPLHPGVALLLGLGLKGDTLLDASGSGGLVALASRAKRKRVLESSQAALECARWTFTERDAAGAEGEVELVAGAPWDAPLESADVVVLAPQTDRGSARVQAELVGAQRALHPGGAAYFAMHKDQGAKRYEKLAQTLFGEVTVLAREGGWRVVRATKRLSAPLEVAPLSFSAAGLSLQAEPGVFAAGKLDPGTARLLDALSLTRFAGQRLLELGCGYGVLALKASLAGAEVTAVDDDLLAVRATHRNAQHYGADVRALHSDVDSAVQGETFDTVLMNPPFHVGKQVVLDVPRAFLAAAYERLVPGGTLVLVANRALPYERELTGFARHDCLFADAQFKVLRAVR